VNQPFPLAFPVRDLDATRAFYGDLLGCAMGRDAATWQDFDVGGHQLSAHVTPGAAASSGQVDGLAVPIPHFGVVLGMDAWQALVDRLRARDVTFLIEPQVRFPGAAGEQGTFFVRDPADNTLEFKGFRDLAAVFATGREA
jgi:extradiol dioxygenase family protein